MTREELICMVEDSVFSPLKWGRNDCAMLFANVCKALSDGECDPAKGLRGYRTPAGGIKKLKKAGYGSILELARDMLQEIAPGEARDFDFGMVDIDELPKERAIMTSPAVLIGANLFSLDETGPVITERRTATWFFRVPGRAV